MLMLDMLMEAYIWYYQGNVIASIPDNFKTRYGTLYYSFKAMYLK